MNNVDENEVKKFSLHAKRWWDKNGPLKTLHQINPLRLKFIKQEVSLTQQPLLDVGCGGGILTESLAKSNAKVTGIDQSLELIQIAKLHQKTSHLDIDYYHTTIEEFKSQNRQKFNIITCLELLEHVPNPQQLLTDAIHLLKPNGSLFVSTINRTPKAFALAIVAAEYIFRLLPQGTHDYKKLIKPAEIAAWARKHQCDLIKITGMSYNPLQQTFYLTHNTSMLYTMHLKKRAHS